MKRVLISLLFIVNTIYSQTTLNPGDIAVIGFKTNNNTDGGNDAIKLVTLVDLLCNTTFIITDNNWNNSTSSWSCNDDEFALEITCSSAIPAGSVFYLSVDAAGDVATCSGGTITKTSLGSPWGANFGLSSQGDNVYILQGTRTSPTFIYAFKNNTSFSNTTCSDKDQAGLPSGLALGTSALISGSKKDQWHYNCVNNNGTKASILTSINNISNWVSSSGQNWDNSTCIFTISGGIIPTGVLAVSGSGCGCLANCNLAYSGGTNCGSTGVSGDCSAGYQNMSKVIPVPVGCTYSVSAEMKPRSNGCSSSGADGNCQTCDVVKVDIQGGSKSFQQGGSNSSLLDSYSATGPATIVVSGRANRADEIITYSIKVTPCSCFDLLLPVELIQFKAVPQESNVELIWSTMSENNNMYFTVEKSSDAIHWEVLTILESLGNSKQIQTYSVFDSTPFEGRSYYRLKQTDNNSHYSYSRIESIYYKKITPIEIYPNPNNNGILKISTGNLMNYEIKLIDVFGKVIYNLQATNSLAEIDLNAFGKGVYTIIITSNNSSFSKKVIYN